ncbi:hypothetical protein D3C72_2042090 [compost metagenome]
MKGVDHQADIGPDRFAHGRAGLEVHLHIRRPADGRHPGVKLDALVTALHQRFGEPAIVFRRCKASFQLVPTHDRAIGEHLVAITTNQLVYRLSEAATGKVPERAVHHRQRAVR